MNYPEFIEVKGKKYKINTDFRVAIKCNEIAENEDVKDFERAMAIIYLLFGEDAIEDYENLTEILELAKKFLACGKEVKIHTKERDMDYVEDMDYIEASFMSDYKIDLANTQMHWWKFNKLINGLSDSEFGNCCVLNRVRNIRNMDLKDIKDKKERDKMIKAKKELALKKNNKRKKMNEKQKQSVKEIKEILKRRKR